MLTNRRADLLRRPDGHRRLRDDDHLAGCVPANLLSNGEDVLEVGRSVFVRRRADSDEDDLRIADRRRRVRRETETPSRLIALDVLLESGLVDRQHVPLETVDLELIEIGADYFIPRLGEAGADHKTDVAGPDDSDFHASAPCGAWTPWGALLVSSITRALLRRVFAIACRVSTIRRALSPTN